MIIFLKTMSEDIINKIIENEKSEISYKFKSFDSHRNTLLLYTQSIVDYMKQLDENQNSDQLLSVFADLKQLLNKSDNLDVLFETLTKKLDRFSYSEDSMEIEIKDYNKNLQTLQDDLDKFILELEQFIKDFFDVFNFTLSSPPVLEKESIEEKIELVDNNCLLISEKESKVFLPYKIKDLNEQLAKSTGKYSSLNELIQKEYTLPIERFQNPVLSRFREAYNLMKSKESSSFLDAINLGLELSWNSTLNPAVIAACKNKDELDIYLDCLYEKELEQFKIFEIKCVERHCNKRKYFLYKLCFTHQKAVQKELKRPH